MAKQAREGVKQSNRVAHQPHGPAKPAKSAAANLKTAAGRGREPANQSQVKT